MKPYFALLAADLRVSLREPSVLFFNYAFPLIFFFMFGEMMDAGKSLGSAQFIVSTVIAIGIMGNGFFGVGMRAVLTHEFRQEEIVDDLRPDAVIDRLQELPGVVERLGKDER